MALYLGPAQPSPAGAKPMRRSLMDSSVEADGTTGLGVFEAIVNGCFHRLPVADLQGALGLGRPASGTSSTKFKRMVAECKWAGCDGLLFTIKNSRSQAD